jgi:hypothetical protein
MLIVVIMGLEIPGARPRPGPFWAVPEGPLHAGLEDAGTEMRQPAIPRVYLLRQGVFRAILAGFGMDLSFLSPYVILVV